MSVQNQGVESPNSPYLTAVHLPVWYVICIYALHLRKISSIFHHVFRTFGLKWKMFEKEVILYKLVLFFEVYTAETKGFCIIRQA